MGQSSNLKMRSKSHHATANDTLLETCL
jgi:hypothetical protein